MSRYRLLPTPAQQAVLREHCGHARYVWNLAVEQHQHWHPGRTSAPGYLEQRRQLTQARAEYPWLAGGSQTVQQQALRDFAQALKARRLTGRAPGRVEKIKPHYTSQRCSACGHVDGNSRESQARFACTACGFADHADVNAARNIAAGHAVTARGGFRDAGPVNREPQLLLQSGW